VQKAANSQTLKLHNRQAVLQAVRRYGPISRVEVAARTGLSQPAVTSVVRELIEESLIIEEGLGQSSGGRPPILLVFNPRVQFVLAAVLEPQRIRGALADLNGEVRVESVAEVTADDPVQALIAFLHGLIEQAGEDPIRLAAICLGVPGIATGQGAVSHAPGLGWWQDVPLGEILQATFKAPVRLENDVNLMALGEQTEGAGKAVQDLVLVHVSDGIGSGILLNGQLFRGSRGAAGEIGYLPLGPVVPRQPQDYGLFELHYSTRGLLSRLAAFTAVTPQTEPVSLLKECVAQELPWAKALYDDLLRYWAYALAAIVCIINPERLILAGNAVATGPEGLARLCATLQSLVPLAPEVRFGALGDRAGLVGAIALALQEVDRDRSVALGPAPASAT
jgi:predicted NBD/HSP70 family sugar kinase